MIGGRAWLTADPVIFYNPSFDQPTYQLIIFLDDSTSRINQAIVIFDALTGELLNVLHAADYGLQSISNLLAGNYYQITVSAERIIVCSPTIYGSRSVFSYTIDRRTTQPKPSLAAGQVVSAWYTGFGHLQGQSVLVDSDGQSVYCSSILSEFYIFTISIVCYSPSTKQIINQFTTLTGVTSLARSIGVSSNLTDYLIVAMVTNPHTNLMYLSQYYNRQLPDFASVPSGILIITQFGQFVDFVPGFDCPQTVFF